MTGVNFFFPAGCQFHIPGKTGVLIDKDMPVGEEWIGRFPGELNAQFILVKVNNEWLSIGTKSKRLYFPWIKILRLKNGFRLTWNSQPRAPFPEAYDFPGVSRKIFDSFDEAVNDYRKWMVETFSIREKSGNQDVPDWLRKTRLVLIIDLWRSNGEIAHDYQDVIDLIKEIKKKDIPEETILYLPGWSWKYDGRYPEYLPAKELGGEKKFKELIYNAHKNGYRLMLHMSVWGLSPDSPAFNRFRRFQVTNPQGKKLGWAGTTPAGATLPLLYIRPCAGSWRRYLISKIARVVKRFGIDAVYLDQMGVTYNDPGCDLVKGTHRLCKELRQKLPGILIGGEIVNERVVSSVPLWQLWGAPWSTEEVIYEKTSPILIKLFGDYVYFFAHLGVPAGVPAGYTWTNYPYIVKYGRERAFKIVQHLGDKYGIIKTLRLNYRDYGIDRDSIREINKIRIKT